MRYLRVKNYERFQHYKNGAKPPAWLKLYRSLLTDSEFMALSDSERSQLILIWLLASQNHNRVPFDNHLVARQLQSRRVNLQHFIDLKFLLLDGESREGLEHIDATTLATNKKENKKEIPPVAPPSGEPRLCDSPEKRKRPADVWKSWFDSEFVPKYPEHRRVQAATAIAELRKIRPEEGMKVEILARLERWSTSSEWQRDDGAYVPGMGKFFKDGWWKREPARRQSTVAQYENFDDYLRRQEASR